MDPKDYEGREQALVKHTVLEGYLQRLALKVGQFRRGTTLNYVDGFSGPYDHGAPLESDRPTSPFIALRKLRDVREQLRAGGVPLTVRGLFVESDPAAFGRLDALCARSGDVETVRIHGEFEGQIERAVAFARQGPNPFSFIFIDPTGWTGFGLRRITPLLQVKPGEVLVNFMLKDILRFVDDERHEIRNTFEDLFGADAESFRREWMGLEGLDREDAIVRAYCERVRIAGGYAHCVSTIVFNPRSDRTHYHLVYGTRSLHGLVTFRQIEKHATDVQKNARATAKRNDRTARTGQGELFTPVTMETPYVEVLTKRYRSRARRVVEDLIAPGDAVTYESLVEAALDCPLTSETELKAWLGELKNAGEIEIALSEGDRTPKIGKRHVIRRRR